MSSLFPTVGCRSCISRLPTPQCCWPSPWSRLGPVSLTGYFYHPLMIGVVHLVTLGWISSSILGAIFIVGPLVLRMPMRVGVNFVVAGVLGLLIGADRDVDVVPGSSISNVYAHAHLAGLGWATLMVVGVGYRLLPMVLPSAIPEGLRVVTSLVLLQLGIIGVSTTLLMTGEASLGWTVFVVAGIVTFLSGAVWMGRHPRSPPPARPKPDWAVGHAFQSLVYLLIASLIGLALVLVPTTTWTARLAMLYGIVALVGFLSQVVIGMEHRILPLFQWHTRFKASGFADQPPSPHTMGSQSIRAAVFGLWTVGVPVFAVGMAMEQVTVVGIGGWALLVAVALHSVNTVRTLRFPAR